jgi:hypothetical protein
MQRVERDLRTSLQNGASGRTPIPSNLKAERGTDGRIAPDAPAYSPSKLTELMWVTPLRSITTKGMRRRVPASSKSIDLRQ